MLYDGTKDGERREVAIGYFHRYIQITNVSINTLLLL
jgi:hypothetical protein